jgi:hypothetical protein
MIAVPAVDQAPALVRIQEGSAPIAVATGRAGAVRFVRVQLHSTRTDASAWRPGYGLNWVRGSDGRSHGLLAFFVRDTFVGAAQDFGDIGRFGRAIRRTSTAATFAVTLLRVTDPACCPHGRTIEMRFSWNGSRLVATRPLLRAGIEASEGLQTPSRNIGCIFNRSPRLLRCDVRTELRPKPPRPAGCDLDWGYGLQMTLHSRARTFCAGDSALGQGPFLAYGARLRLGGFTCTSRPTGLTCANAAHHGFVVARERWRAF